MKDISNEFKTSTMALLIAAGKADYIQGKSDQKKIRSKKTGYIARGSETHKKPSASIPINRPSTIWDSISISND